MQFLHKLLMDILLKLINVLISIYGQQKALMSEAITYIATGFYLPCHRKFF